VFEEIIAGLTAAGVRFVVIGGVAATVHGSARLTNDIDICYDPAADNRESLARLLNGWNAYLREVEPGLPFVMDGRQLRTTPVMTLITDRGAVDIFDRVAGVGDYDKVLAASVPAVVGDTRFRVLSLDGLIAAKKAAGRPRDREHLIELEALRAILKREH
jgi:predicted nucleotidyltransferase